MVLAIALSGGVDSSVAASLLRADWPQMVGASHIIWPGSRCCSVEVLDRAREVCRRLDMPYLQVDLYDRFREEVVGDFISTYLSGKTPNPCVVCNRSVRFDAFYGSLQAMLRAQGVLAQGERLFFATGHYARIVQTEQGMFLGKGKDPVKDQSYMLYQVKREMLPYLVLPLGEYLKRDILSLAEELDLRYATVRESQDACFVEGSYVDFIRIETGRSDFLCSGNIVDLNGVVLGRHRGTIHYTVGQRRGLGLRNGPWYVARIEPAANRVVVARREEAESSSFRVEESNWFIEAPAAAQRCSVKIRYQIRDIPCSVEPEGGSFRVVLDRAEIVTPGQSAVFYRESLVLGGGVIAWTLRSGQCPRHPGSRETRYARG